MAKKGFMKLKGNELKSLEGLVAVIELQEGCPHRCLGCGADSKKPGDSMDYEDVMAISKSIEKVRKENGIELLIQNDKKNILFFYGSDPVYYSSHCRGLEKNIFDVGKEVFSRHGKHMYFTTAGWKPGNNYMERAMAQIAENNREGEDRVTKAITYSIKPFGLLIRKEYERFCNRLLGSVFDMGNFRIRMKYKRGQANQIIRFKRDFPKDRKDYVNELNMEEWRWLIKEHLTDFFKESRYVHQLTENMKTLQGADVYYSCQYMESMISNTAKKLQKENRKYEFLLSGEFMATLADYCSQKAGGNQTFKTDWCWGGFGRAKTELGLKPADLEQTRMADIEEVKEIEHDRDRHDYLFAKVLFDGTINIMYGKYDSMASVYVPEEYFSRMAESFRDKDNTKSAYYRTLAGLQGRNILR